MKVLFMGTPEFAVPVLRELTKGHEVVAVVTQPDKPKGRGKKIQYSPVKDFAVAHGIPVLQPIKIKYAAEELGQYSADIFIVAAYGQLLSVEILNMPLYGCLNVHGSLLPKYRGAAPIQWAVINGEEQTGITIMQMNKGLDTGDMLLKKELEILPEDTGGSLHDKMSEMGAALLIDALNSLNELKPEKQDDSGSSYAPMITKVLGHINWDKSSKEIVNLVRGLNPWVATYSYYKMETFKIWHVEAVNGYTKGTPGEIIEILDKGLIVKTADGAVLVEQIQAVGGKRMSVADYLRGHIIELNYILN